MKEYHPGLEGYHPGLEGVIATESSISDINGEKGILSYRGYSIEDLAKKTSFEETSYLLLTGDLPSKSELDSFTQKVNASRELPNDFIKLLKNIPKSTKTMDVLQCTVSSLASFYDIEFDAESLKKGKYSGEYFIDVSAKILGSIGSIVAAWNRIKNGKDYINADAKLNYADNFLHMLNDKDELSPIVKRIIDASLVLHAEHTINASTFTAMVTASTLAHPVQVIASAIGSLSGPLHGGANEKVVSMLDDIGSKEHAKEWLDKRLNSKQVVWGMGHREYSTKDPRAKILTAMVEDFFKRFERGSGEILKFLGVQAKAHPHITQIVFATLALLAFVRLLFSPGVDLKKSPAKGEPEDTPEPSSEKVPRSNSNSKCDPSTFPLNPYCTFSCNPTFSLKIK